MDSEKENADLNHYIESLDPEQVDMCLHCPLPPEMCRGNCKMKQDLEKKKSIEADKKRGKRKKKKSEHFGQKVYLKAYDMTFDGVKEAAAYIGVKPCSMYDHLAGRNRTCKGFIFTYVDDFTHKIDK